MAPSKAKPNQRTKSKPFLVYYWTISCYHCGTRLEVFECCLWKKDAVKQATDEGWINHRTHGWTCAACALIRDRCPERFDDE